MSKKEIILMPRAGGKVTVMRIMKLALDGKCLEFRGKRIPAAIVQNWQARYLVNQIMAGHLKEYKPKKKAV